VGEAGIPSDRGQLFRFCQLDFPFPLGPADGRYLRRGPSGEDLAVVSFRALHATRRSRLRGRRPARAEPGATQPEPVAITRATVIAAQPFPDASAAAQWLRGCGGDRDAAAAEVEDALGSVNEAVSAHRVAALDPYVREVTAGDAQRVRLGFGTGDEVIEDAWHEALVIPPERAKRRPRRQMLSPEQEMAGMLSGRRPGAWPSEELVLRARTDLDQGRLVEAALMAHAAMQALNAEGEAGASSAPAAGLARAALSAELSEGQAAELAELVTSLERTARRRRYAEER
jgi:hypothetical protein